MRITKLTLKNWGPHALQEIDMDAPVFGLIGPNGSGKTNVLEAIEFALTGNLQRAQDTYVRRVSGDDAPKNGSVEMTFVKDGVEGTILRQVGATPKRQLTWEGKKHTKVADIDAILNDVLDCDRRAVSLAVFLNQGKIGDFLFSNLAERERMFATICLVDHLPKVAEVIEQRLFDLRQMTSDQTATRDEALTVLETAKAALQILENEFKEMKDWSAAITWLRKVIALQEEFTSKRNQVQNQQGVLVGIAERTSLVIKPACLEGDAAEWIETKQALLKSQEGVRSRITALETQVESRKTLEEDLATIKREEAEILALVPEVGQVNDRVTNATAKLAEKQVRDGKVNAVTNIQRNLAASKDQLATLEGKEKEFAEALPKVEASEKELAQIREDMPMLKVEVELLEKLSGSEDVIDCCPLCKNRDMTTLQKELGRLPELRTTLDKWVARVPKLDGAINDWKTRRQHNEGSLITIRKNITDLEEALVRAQADLQTAGPEIDGVAVEAELKAARQRQTELVAKTGGMPNLLSRKAQTENRLAAMPTLEQLHSNLLAVGKEVVDVTSVQPQIDEVRRYLAAVKAIEDERSQAAAVMTRLQTEAGELEGKMTGLLNAKPSGIMAASADTVFGPTLDDLSARQRERDAKQGGIAEAVQNMRRAETRLKEIDHKIARQGRVMNTISLLEQLKTAFSREGIQRHYLMKVYDALLEGTQQNLSAWEEDFMVEKDPGKPFNFQFFRTDDPETLLDQSQLSGGQRVRLSISFLLAVQQLVIPELNFMVLDEPTTHLDQEGVDGLSKLFRTMAEHLDDAEAQVIVVDHHPSLARSFSKSKDLTRVDGEEEEG